MQPACQCPRTSHLHVHSPTHLLTQTHRPTYPLTHPPTYPTNQPTNSTQPPAHAKPQDGDLECLLSGLLSLLQQIKIYNKKRLLGAMGSQISRFGIIGETYVTWCMQVSGEICYCFVLFPRMLVGPGTAVVPMETLASCHCSGSPEHVAYYPT